MKITKTKKALCFLMTILMAFSSLAVASFAADAEICEHEYYEGYEVIVDSTCTTTGVLAQKCKKCGTPNYDTLKDLPRKDHRYKWTTLVPATYESTGSEKGVCVECGFEAQRVIPVITCAVHSTAQWAENAQWVTTLRATCVDNGKEQAYCDVCKRSVVKDIPALGHAEVVLKGYEPTCTEYGKTDGVGCYECHNVVVSQNWIKPRGHLVYTIVEKEATCQETGIAYKYCSRENLVDGEVVKCDYKEKVELEKIPHADANGDGICDDEDCQSIICRCFCHKDTFIARFVRFINTLLSNLLNKDFRCCDCMEPYEK